VLFATNLMRGGGVLIVLILGLALWRLWRMEARRRIEMASAEAAK
jgi:hypothetical protein